MNDGGVCRTAPATPGLLKKDGFELNKLNYKKKVVKKKDLFYQS